jgi:hypothetical protein
MFIQSTEPPGVIRWEAFRFTRESERAYVSHLLRLSNDFRW